MSDQLSSEKGEFVDCSVRAGIVLVKVNVTPLVTGQGYKNAKVDVSLKTIYRRGLKFVPFTAFNGV